MYIRQKRVNGFALIEIIFALALWTFIFPAIVSFLFSIHMKSLSLTTTLSDINFAEKYAVNFDVYSSFSRNLMMYSFKLPSITNFLFDFVIEDMNESYGLNNCDDLNTDNLVEIHQDTPLIFSSTNHATNIIARNSIVYISMNSSSTTDPDLYTLDVKDPTHPIIINNLDSGPGISDMVLAGYILYVGNISVKNQVLAYDMYDPRHPVLLWSYKINGSNASTSPLTKALAFYNHLLVFGTQKTPLSELYVLDITTTPTLIDEFEIGSGVNDVFGYKNKLFVSSPLDPEVQVFDMNTLNNSLPITIYDAPGGSGNGKRLEIYNNEIYLGRTLGGQELNVLTYMSNTSTNPIQLVTSVQIKASIDGLVSSKDYIYLLTSDSTKELQIWKKQFNAKGEVNKLSFSKGYDLPSRATGITCSGTYLYISLDSNEPLRIFKKNDE